MKASSLAKLFAIYDLALVDTSSLMEDSFPAFMDVLANSKDYWKEGFKVVLLGDCLDELNKHSKDKNEHLKAIAAKQALKIIKKDQKRTKTFEIRKSLRQDIFADAALMSVATAEHIHNKLLVITQDKNLTRDLLNLNNLESQRGRWLKVYHLDETGSLVESDGNQSSNLRKDFSSERNKTTSRPSFFKQKETEKKANPLLAEVLKKDQILNSNLSNGAYPIERKKTDIENQLSLLSKLSFGEKDKLKLTLPEGKLKEALNKYKGAKKEEKPLQKPNKKNEEKPAQKPSDFKKPQPKASEIKTNKPVSEHFFNGNTYEEAFGKLAMSKGWILRDPSVPYFSGVHGPYDISLGDMETLESLGKEAKANPISVEFKGLNLLLKKENGQAYCAIANPKTEEKKIEAIPTPPVVVKTVIKEEPKSEELKPATLIVALPEETPKKKRVSKKTVKEDEEVKAPSVTTKKPTSKKEKASSEPKKAGKVTEKKPATEKPKPAKKASEKKNPKKKEDNSKLIGETQKADLQLNANLNNPNYPDARAIADINAQLTRLQALSPSEKKGMLLSQAELEKRAKELKEKISQK